MRLPIGVVAVCVALCGACGDFAMAQENRKLWIDKGEREEFVRELTARKIPFRIDAEGGIWYPAKEVDTIDAISKGILEKNAGPGIYYDDPTDAAAFRKRLEDASIPYQIRRKADKEWIFWDKQYDTRVATIRDLVDSESLERSRERRRGK